MDKTAALRPIIKPFVNSITLGYSLESEELIENKPTKNLTKNSAISVSIIYLSLPHINSQKISTKNTNRLITNPPIKLIIKPNKNELFLPSIKSEKKIIHKTVTPITTPLTTTLIIGCSEALKLAINTLIIISTRIVRILFSPVDIVKKYLLKTK
ncbi:hypothetical protein L293_1463 [Acinetobacter gyllenbergii CIP 110306 = MTCC 11365]|nr:hypothetical protein L293_1463 [Acinetobacter gyllenbergii CIP 110306 = MTCC 11365]